MKPLITLLLCGCTVLISAFSVACSANEETQSNNGQSSISTTDSNITYSGEESFINRCAVCHGETGTGSPTGPPLVNRLYEIGHHGDQSFHNAVNNGVVAHHWNFGNMPAIPGVSEAEIDAIICHVRDLQRAEGIAAGEPC